MTLINKQIKVTSKILNDSIKLKGNVIIMDDQQGKMN